MDALLYATTTLRIIKNNAHNYQLERSRNESEQRWARVLQQSLYGFRCEYIDCFDFN